MDSSLIHLIPNLMAAYNSRNKLQSLPHDSPPPYTRDPNATEVPLTIELMSGPKPSEDSTIRPVEKSYQGKIALSPGFPGYKDMIIDVKGRLITLGVSEATGSWWVAITVELKGRGLFRGSREVDILDGKGWVEVRPGLEEGRVRGLRVMCWKD